MDEFDLIKRFFYNLDNQRLCTSKGVVLGNGDDAVVFDIDPNYQLVSSIDTLVENVHFPSDVPAEDIAYKALAVNLSDLAAMGASPHSFVMSLTLPELNIDWLEKFSEGLFLIANRYGIALVGGDTSRGPLSISIQVNGIVQKNSFLTRSAAKPLDIICVTGFLGLGAQGLLNWQQGDQCTQGKEGNNNASLQKFLRPEPRINFASKLFDLGVRACIDVSDGLLSEVNHVCQASRISARINLSAIPVHEELGLAFASASNSVFDSLLRGGDDYELCIAVQPECLSDVNNLAIKHGLTLFEVGEFTAGYPSQILDWQGDLLDAQKNGYNHFDNT